MFDYFKIVCGVFFVPDTENDTSVMAKKQEPSQTTGDTGEGEKC